MLKTIGNVLPCCFKFVNGCILWYRVPVEIEIVLILCFYRRKVTFRGMWIFIGSVFEGLLDP